MNMTSDTSHPPMILRPLSARSYEILERLRCPAIVEPAQTMADRYRCAALWRVVHEEPMEWVKSATDEAIIAKAEAFMEGDLAELAIFPTMARELKKMNDAFVETESEPGAGE